MRKREDQQQDEQQKQRKDQEKSQKRGIKNQNQKKINPEENKYKYKSYVHIFIWT